MNLVLFEPAELAQPLPSHDRRALHVLNVLRRTAGDTFDAGVINGPRGKATLLALDSAGLHLAFTPAPDSASRSAPDVAPRRDIVLIVGLTRPQTARDILRDATTLGAATLHFVLTEKSEPSYAQSTLWSSGEWRRHVLAGAEQAFATHIPVVTTGETLAKILHGLPPATVRLALDNYEASIALGAAPLPPSSPASSPSHAPTPPPTASAGAPAPTATPVVLALGGERGWSANERATLRAHGFTLAHLGDRVLRTETAVIAALAIVHSRLALLSRPASG